MNRLSVCVWIACVCFQVSAKVSPTIEHIMSAGYLAEEHRLVTDDGYLLVMYRIPPTRSTSRVVVYFPGLFTSSMDLVFRGRDEGFGFLLSDSGFDVWLSNYRGTTDDPLTVYTNKTDPWDFSMDEHSKYDFPAIINYVLSRTGVKQVSTVGLSMAGNVVLGGLTHHPELNNRINMNVFFAPTPRLKYMKARLKMVGPHWRFFNKLRKSTGVGWFPSVDMKLFHETLSAVCSLPQIGSFICSSIFYTTENIVFPIEKALLPKIFQHYPNRSSSKSVIHYFQLMGSGRFSHYDYDTEGNMKRYDQPSPPDYDLSKVTSPVAIFYSKYDTMVNYKDAEWLANELVNSSNVTMHSVPKHNFAHLSFQFDPDIRNVLHIRVLKLLLSL